MPNYVYNSVNINGDPNQVSNIMKKLGMPNLLGNGESGTDGLNRFNFYNLVSPSDLDWYKESENWYNWRIANWGTKWNACDLEVDYDDVEDINNITYRFSTAWSPPIPIMLALIEYIVYNNIHVNMNWHYEEEQGWGGEYDYTPALGLQLVEEWDVPDSHEDCMLRRSYCWRCADGEELYPDCPGYNEQDEEDLES